MAGLFFLERGWAFRSHSPTLSPRHGWALLCNGLRGAKMTTKRRCFQRETKQRPRASGSAGILLRIKAGTFGTRAMTGGADVQD